MMEKEELEGSQASGLGIWVRWGSWAQRASQEISGFQFGPWRPGGPEARRSSFLSAAPFQAVAVTSPPSAALSAGMQRPAASQVSALQENLAMIG